MSYEREAMFLTTGWELLIQPHKFVKMFANVVGSMFLANTPEHAMIEIQADLVAGLTLLAHADIMTERTSLGRSLRSKHNRPQIKYRMSTSSHNDSFKAFYDVFNDLTLYFSPVYCSPVVCFVQMWAGRADIEQVWRMLACE